MDISRRNKKGKERMLRYYLAGVSCKACSWCIGFTLPVIGIFYSFDSTHRPRSWWSLMDLMLNGLYK